ncbi:Gfo/Idh/MocA family protein [Robertmurraya korlensis]|uniref:Gfo/Idh/MocA family protein n=1 Tax=Robertmurraya korlensis TaxID=519977 RepID=UPI0008262E09|nr:Gfo/Idh/MocA family oxidoreductase [Robertmurraya korlensis]
MNRNYKIAIVGLGSIGTRHLKNIVSVLNERKTTYVIDVIRSSNTPIERHLYQLVNRVFYKYEDVPSDYDVIFVTNPTHLHFNTIKQYALKTKHMFIEKPVFDHSNHPIHELPLNKEAVYYVACPLRYTNVISYLKESISATRVYCARVICSSYLPDWRPNVDYKITYSARKSQGGGVPIDLIHEWDYLCYLFGKPEEVFNIKGKFSELHIDSEDLSIYIARYKDMLAEVHLDYFGREPIREVQLFTANETVVGDLIKSEIRFLKSGRVLSLKESRDDFQRKEITYFFDTLEGKRKNHNDILSALQILNISKEGKV